MPNIQTWYLICNFTKELAPLCEGRNFRKNIALNKKLDKRMATTDESDFYFVLVFGFLLLLYSILFFVLDTGKSLSEAPIFVSTNPQYDKRLFIELQVQYMKIPS